MKNNFNGFDSQEAYEEALEILTDIRENNDNYDRDITSVTKEEGFVELVIDDYSIQIWDEDVEVYILNGKERLVDCGIMNICCAILEGLRDGSINFNE